MSIRTGATQTNLFALGTFSATLSNYQHKVLASQKLNVVPTRTPKPKCLATWTEDDWTRFLYKNDVKVGGVRYRCLQGNSLELSWRGPKGGTRKMRFIPSYRTGANHFVEIVEFLHLIELRGVNTIREFDTEHTCRHFV